MNKCLCIFLFLLMTIGSKLSSVAQYGHSPFVDSLLLMITDSSLSLFDRQLSGDTSAVIGGVTDTIKTRHSNYPDNALAAQYILEKFQSFGLPAEFQQYDPNGFNVIATITGTVYPDEQFIICAHYDDAPNGPVAPGADDNASGTSAVLEAARVLSPFTFDYTLKFIAFDEEEQSMIGSKAYADTADKYNHIILGVINLDMITWDGNNDFEYCVSSNTASIPLLGNYTDIQRIYQPVLSPQLILIPNSDHSSFWYEGYQAILAIEEYQLDFQPYYHTVNDLYQYVNHPYFLAMSKGAISALATMGRNYMMTMAHLPLGSDLFTGDRQANLLLTSPNPVDLVNYKPRLYYKIDNQDFEYLVPSQIAGDTFKFMIPGQMPGSKVSYYFAAQDADGEYAVTLPESGKGVNPPGTVPPPVYYSYYILNDTSVTAYATGLPWVFPANQTSTKIIPVTIQGQLLDVNISMSINHAYDRRLNLYLVSPSGKEVMLSTKNGYNQSNYINTVFDDEASTIIFQGYPPFTGNFKPEQPLSAFDDTVSNGNWYLKIVNNYNVQGTVTNLCMVMTIAKNDYYVDASRPSSGNGRSWSTAFKTISEATVLEPPAGSVVFIKPGTYHEDISITSSGHEIVPLKTGITILNQDKIQFPSGTNLTGIDLTEHPGEYYACVFRSRNFNNGYYQVKSVNDAADYILISENVLLDESGSSGDSLHLSACIMQPVIYRKYSPDPENQRVLADASGDTGITTMLYIGEAIGDGLNDAVPANYNMIDGIDLTGSVNGGGVHLQSSSFNIIANSRIYELNGAGVLINGNTDHKAQFNIVINNEIYNTPDEGIRIGAFGMPAYTNQTHFTHLVGNNIHASGSGIYAALDHAVDIIDFNTGTWLEKNFIHDLDLSGSGNGAVEINSGTDHTVLNGNVFKNIGTDETGTFSVIRVHDLVDSVDIFNNIIFNQVYEDNDICAFRIDATGHIGSRLVQNTVYNIDNGLLLEDYGDQPDFEICNNIFHIYGQYFEHWGTEGRYLLSHNYYNEDPAPQAGMPYFGETGRQVGEVSLVNPAAGDFHPAISDELLICNGLTLEDDVLLDPGGATRDTIQPDIGAFELRDKIVWTGLVNQNWSNPGNWNWNTLPSPVSNVVIQHTIFDPVLDIDATLKGLLMRQESSLIIQEGKVLQQF